MSDIITCVGCGRGVRTIHGCYNRHHSVKGGGTYCFMSEQHAPITGHTDQAMISKAQLVAKLAMRIQDEDPHQVWRYLTAMPGELVQEMLMIAARRPGHRRAHRRRNLGLGKTTARRTNRGSRMKDSRLQQALAALDDARTTLADITSEMSESPDHTTLILATDRINRAIDGVKAVAK